MEILEQVKTGTHFLKFYANWCGPCKTATTVLEKWQPSTEVNIIDINIDKHSDIAQEYAVRGIPTIIVFKDGTLVDRISGVPNSEFLSKYE
tara:strand:- start:356 stop:628 length:273 start_codon:yes stop_codon:yes gene_type:complete